MQACLGEWRPQYLQGPLVPPAFKKQAVLHPRSPCLVAEDGSVLTYAQTDAAATALARRLAAQGVGLDAAVGILLDRSPSVIVSMLAVHKAGGCYVPLDPNFPADRLSIYLEDSQAVALITEHQHLGLAADLVANLPCQPKIVLYDDCLDDCTAAEELPLPDLSLLQPSDLAYIMFTSGSTGRPKGVMVTHGGVRDLVAFNVERFALGPEDVFCLNSTVGFDSYVTYVFASLTIGGRLVVPGPSTHLDPTGMAALIATHGITTMECVPALATEYLHAFRAAGDRLACLTRFLTGGEALTPKLAEEIVNTLPGLAKGGLFNSYGPTEVTVTTITGHITAPFDHIPMGHPDHNVVSYVVVVDEEASPTDERHAAPSKARLAVQGEPGELWLSGPRLARGYRNRPDLTAKAFVPNPFFTAATAGLPADAEALLRPHYRLAYRTGDLVLMNKDGSIDFLGRMDRQVKVNGVRMEVGEVENVLAGAPGVTHAAVKPWKDAAGAYRLVGYVSPANVDLDATDTYLRSKLLPAMVPSQLVVLDVMPRLPNGKIDVKSLTEPAWGPAAGADGAAAEGVDGSDPAEVAAAKSPLELLMCEAWAEVLHLPVEKLGVTANFFALGGSSLRAGLINSKVRRITEFDIPGLLIYKHPTIRSLCGAIEEEFGSYPWEDDDCGSTIGALRNISSSDGSGSSRSASLDFSRCPSCSTSSPPSAADIAIRMPSATHAGSSFSKCGEPVISPLLPGQLPGWLSTLLQILPLSALGVFLYALALPGLFIGAYLYGSLEAPLWLLPVHTAGLAVIAFSIGLAFTIAWKWILIGKQQPGRHAIWSWYYIRWWMMRMFIKSAIGPIFPFIRATPLIVWFYRALGAKIGKGVIIDSANIFDWDLIEIGDNVAIEHNACITGSHMQAGTHPKDPGYLDLSKTCIDSGCSLLPQSIVSPGTSLPAEYILYPGNTSARPPSGPSDDAAHKAARTEPGPLPTFLWTSSTVTLLVVFSFSSLTIIPAIAVWWAFNQGATPAQNWRELLVYGLNCWLAPPLTGGPVCARLLWTEALAFCIMPVSGGLLGVVYMWMMVAIKWVLVGRITPRMLANAGHWTHLRLHLWRCLIKGPFIGITYMWTSTEVFNAWLRALGAKIGRQCWLSEMFSCSEYEMYEVEDTASVCSVVNVVGATNSHTKRVKLGEACDVTNDCTLYPGCTVGKGAVLGVFTYGAPDRHFEDYSITLGDFQLRSGIPEADIESGVSAGKLESAATRLIPTWQYELYNICYIAFAMTVFTLTGTATFMPSAIAALAVMYTLGAWPSIFVSLLYGPLAYFFLIGYLALMKRIIMPHMEGEYPIFKSIKAAKWQMLALNAHIYNDFNALKGSLWYNLYLRAMGTKVGRGVACMGGVVAEYEQVSIGEGTVVNEGTFILTHTVENRCAKIRPISIGTRVTIGGLCAVLPDAAMEDGSSLADMSLVMKGETVGRGSHWAGVPACAARKGRK